MKELSLHLLDIVQNSTRANACEVAIEICEDHAQNLLQIRIADNGCGMMPEVVARITDPFSTSRTTRRVGLGLALLKAAAEQCQGSLTVTSQAGQGTTVTATFHHDHIDRAPLGDLTTTLIGIIIGNPTCEFSYRHCVDGRTFTLDTRDIKQELGDVPINNSEVVNFLHDYLDSQIQELYKEADSL